MSRRLLIISALGIVLIGGAYWYVNRPPEAPPQPPARPRRVARPQPPTPPPPIKPPDVKPEAGKPPAVEPPAAEQQGEVRPEVPETQAKAPTEAQPKVSPEAPVAGPQGPSEVAKPSGTRPEFEKPAPEPIAKTTVPEVEPKRPYSVQVASLVVKRNAGALQKRLEKLGYRATVRKKTARITRHRVYAGEFRDREEADQVARRLSADGFSPRLVAGEQGKFAVEVGGSFNQNDAIDLARRLQQKNYTSQIVTKTAPTPVYVVRVGAYEKKSEALLEVKTLKQKGFAPFVVRR
ncbi:MAG: SPOR domain-containing protein [Candidatus Methylomirabilales bacterium]